MAESDMDFGAVLVGLFITLVVKVIIMIFATIVTVRLYRSCYSRPAGKFWHLIPNANMASTKTMYWSVMCLGVSELTCGIETYVLLQAHSVIGVIHGLASAVGMGLLALGIYKFLNEKIIHHGAMNCVFNKACNGCTLRETPDCKFDRIVLLLGMLLFLATIPLQFVSTETLTTDASRFLLPFPNLNSWYDGVVVPWLKSVTSNYKPMGAIFYYSHPAQILEFKILPGVAAVISLLGAVLVIRKEHEMGYQTLLFALGFLSYSYFEFALFRGIGDVLLGSLGHEFGEVIFLTILSEFFIKFFDNHKPVASR